MYIKKITRVCDVRDCRCTESYAISRSSEPGNSVIICKSCLADALSAIENYNGEETANEVSDTIPPLFFNAEAMGLNNKPTQTEEENNTDDTYSIENTKYICPSCKREFDTEKGLKAHLRSCKKETEDL